MREGRERNRKREKQRERTIARKTHWDGAFGARGSGSETLSPQPFLTLMVVVGRGHGINKTVLFNRVLAARSVVGALR